MTIEPIGFVTIIFGLMGFFLPANFIVFVFFVSTLLGASAALVLDALGGASVPPSHLLLGFMAVILLSRPDIRNDAMRGMQFPRPGFWLLLLVGYSLITAYFFPRMFAGTTHVFAVRDIGSSNFVPLGPTTSNLTQSIYIVGGLACFLMLAGFARTPAGKRVVANAALACAALNLAFAVLDLVTYFTNTTELMSFVRNANYRMLSDAEAGGLKRIVGAFPEASSFGFMTLGYFAFTLRLWFLGVQSRTALLLTVLSFTALMFSTSTTAYVGLSILLGLTLLECGIRMLAGNATRQMLSFLMLSPVMALIVVFVALLNPDVADRVSEMADSMVLSKLSTESGVTRSAMNSQAIQNFFDTYGFGVGNGSLRASSFLVAVISMIGIVGAILYATFLASLFLARDDRYQDREGSAAQRGAKACCLAWLIAISSSGAFIDLGIHYFAFAALACAASTRPYGATIAPHVKFSRAEHA